MKMVTHHKIIIGDSRNMREVPHESVHLIVTSPPYFNVKKLGTQEGNLSNVENYDLYLNELKKIWNECVRVLVPQGKICIDVMDFPTNEHGFVTLKPLHSDITEQIKTYNNMYYFAEIIWLRSPYRRVTGKTGSTGGPMWGSYPYPPTIMTHNIFEHILVFRKKGRRKMPKNKEESRITIKQLYEFTRPVWTIEGVTNMKKMGHYAIFPDELVERLIRMYSFVGDTVLDPFTGTGTTSKVACSLGRNSIGYEINKDYLNIIKEKLGSRELHTFKDKIEMIIR